MKLVMIVVGLMNLLGAVAHADEAQIKICAFTAASAAADTFGPIPPGPGMQDTGDRIAAIERKYLEQLQQFCAELSEARGQ